MQLSLSPAEISALVQPQSVRGATTETIRGIAPLQEAAAGDLSFLGNAKYKADVAGTRASLVLLPPDYPGQPQPNQLFLIVANPSVALARLCGHIEQQTWPTPVPGVHPLASVAADAHVAPSATVGPFCVIESGAVIGEGTHLQAQVFVGRNAQIGAKCWIAPGVVIQSECVVGERVRLHAGVVIGSDGFGYEFVAGRHEKVPQVGTVVIENDVEIGANCTIDRARFSRTVIGEGTKLDNLVQIGHNVIVGKHCLLCAQVGISGSTTVGDYVVLGGQAGVGGHITIGKGVKAGGQSGISTSVEPGSFVNGTPSLPYVLERRLAILHQRLPGLFKRVDQLEAQLRDRAPAPENAG
ncbi:UDP-3-O-(3-hydroxymyristoyl)glucosamine N-acyltransferase [Opitutus terrae]|uniref:UDP-3-O-acylglucosamine N-acyltransferase n=1 Tax=Opitutus terrae (strain DSM 11246 / JCM 15787 / PB90-1) TaxID=452637 RepID=B1ZQK9_OPITP|nr:UDP-3-O-(3-hydroxymyristoyl)glucosamine N-acyltransferase [Opitutus terrae]ACB75618.1 UDP-3-O-(3-hydroxymyristoyl) glucosamine N-acyltransferase [Opitutus terrae PB90-1]